MSMEEKPQIETVLDGCYIQVTYVDSDGAPVLPEVRLKVRKIPIRDMELLGRVWGKPEHEVAIYLNISMVDVARLSDESFSTAMEEGRRLNFISFGKWWKWRVQGMEALGQSDAINKVMQSAIAKAQENLDSVTSSSS